MSTPTVQPEQPIVTAVKTNKKMMQVFKSRFVSGRYIFGLKFTDPKTGVERKSTAIGKSAAFVGYRYLTDVPDEIAELDQVIAEGNPYLYRDQNELEVDVNANPVQEMKDKYIAEFLAAKGKALDASGNITDAPAPTTLNPLSTSQIAAVAIGGTNKNTPLAAALAANKKS